MAPKFSDEADASIEDLMDDKNLDVDFVVCEFEGMNKIVLTEAGKGGRDRVQEILEANPDKAMTGAFLALAVDDREVTRSIRRKYIQFTWMGPDLSPMRKGYVSGQTGVVNERFSQCGLFLSLRDDLDDLAEDSIVKRLLSAGGAHAPTSFDFTNAALAEDE
ncbi:Actin-binding protein, cofilin/tropomyosin family protein, putative [Hondaea fermentalgiana]|uniref:Actin-binding protein, cofilin/tropomyosin family protein, putative n=1 Tax=Hondaea fermentalgiana TaxID=2315210 RepID=A0A2R5GTW6_9STRA|nr:Actin-binding protein, cofilin/tropomyosin family protein, putative [Hondaea fermentalgiana]|eukprot:GBG34290.1 Actin-binding protein, cofilin/tropomyosin family protein, putative [Hondaea fermentalgiana]